MKSEKKSARQLAYSSLLRCRKEARYANLEINAVLERETLSQADKGLYTALVYAVLERELLIDYIISDYVKLPIDKLDSEVRVALQLGAVQIFFFDKIPDHAVCDSTVELIKKSPKRSAATLVNAVLRAMIRDRKTIENKISKAPLHIKYSLPEWVISLWTECYGKEKAVEIAEGFSARAPLTLHTNTLKITPFELLEKISADGVHCRLHPLHSEMLVIEDNINPEKLYGFGEGLFFVQGTASALAVKALDIKPDSVVLDACACPGGKSFAAAMALENKGKIFSFDLHESKLGLIEKGAERLGISVIEVGAHDARESYGKLSEGVDFVIADVPCSGLGVISKKPDIRSKKPEDIARLPEIQYAILENVSSTLKKGGRLLYSTCTLNKAENEDITNKFLETHSGFVREKGYPVTYFPNNETEDGFFTDIIVKV